MGRRRKNGMSAEKQNVMGQIIQMYDVKTTADLQDVLKDLPGGTIQSITDHFTTIQEIIGTAIV